MCRRFESGLSRHFKIGGVFVSVFRIEKSKDYTVMSNHHLRNSELSLRAKGLLSQMLSLPEGWDYTIAGLAKINKEGKDAVRAAVQELEQAGYIERRQKMDAGGKFSSNEYVVYEEPRSASPLSGFPTTVLPTTEKPSTGKPSTEKPLTENPTELNKDISSIDISPPISPPEGDDLSKGGDPPKKSPSRNRGCKSQPDTLPERFEKFWIFYRTHVPPGVSAGNRQKAIRAWDKLNPDDALVNTLAASLFNQTKSQAWKSGIGVPHASTYLNNRGWEDDWGSSVVSAQDSVDAGECEEGAEWVN